MTMGDQVVLVPTLLALPESRRCGTMLFAQVHAVIRVEAVEGGEAKVGVGDVDEFHFLDC